MSTYRERREARADRLDEWASGREARGEAALARARATADMIPLGQPIMSRTDANRRQKMRDQVGRGFADLDKGREMAAKATNIRAAAEQSIYSDDPDAVEALEARVCELEAERARIVAYNKSCRKGAPDVALLDDDQLRKLAQVIRVGQVRADGSFPAYATANLSGNIKRNRDRLARLTAVAS